MSGHIFCPACYTNITRKPKLENIFSNARRPHFSHIPSWSQIECRLRTQAAAGQDFQQEEQAKKAVERGDLIIVPQFLQISANAERNMGAFAQTQIEDATGPVSAVPIARHRSGEFFVSGRQLSVNTICRRFDLNLLKHYLLPGMRVPAQLSKILHNVLDERERNDDVNEKPKLHFGKIRKIEEHRRMMVVMLRSSRHIVDFALTGDKQLFRSRGLDQNSVGKYIIFWGTVVVRGTGYAVRDPGWGEFAILPSVYDRLIETV